MLSSAVMVQETPKMSLLSPLSAQAPPQGRSQLTDICEVGLWTSAACSPCFSSLEGGYLILLHRANSPGHDFGM